MPADLAHTTYSITDCGIPQGLTGAPVPAAQERKPSRSRLAAVAADSAAAAAADLAVAAVLEAADTVPVPPAALAPVHVPAPAADAPAAAPRISTAAYNWIKR